MMTSTTSIPVHVTEEVMHYVPLELIMAFLDRYLPKLVAEGDISHATLLEIKSKWLEMFAFAAEFQTLIDNWSRETGQTPKLFRIPNTVKNRVHSLLDTAEISNLRGLFTYMKGVADGLAAH